MNSRLIDALAVIGGVLFGVIAIWQFLLFVTFKDAEGYPDLWGGINHLWLSLGAAVVGCACAAGYILRHNTVEEIHISK